MAFTQIPDNRNARLQFPMMGRQMTSIDRALLARRHAKTTKTNRAAAMLYTFCQMVTGKLDPKSSYLGSLHAPMTFPAFLLLVLIAVLALAIWLFGAR